MMLTKKTLTAINKYGLDTCLIAFRRSEEGDGARTIGFEYGLKTNQADAAINAGREYESKKQG